MASQTFHLFPMLPPEIRGLIWQFTLPSPRLILLREHRESTLDFLNRCKTVNQQQPQREPHPDLQYFGVDPKNHYVQGYLIGQQLSEFDIQPYEIAASAENFVPLYLQLPGSNFNAEYYALRRGYWYTASSPPTISKVCKESRRALEVSGFSLAYGTRTNDPRTWFNFKSDIIFLMHGLTLRDKLGVTACIDNTPWNIGQMRPGDMTRVRRLALDVRQPFSLTPTSNMTHSMTDISTAVRLFGGLEELFLALDCEGQECLPRGLDYSDTWGVHEKGFANSNLPRLRYLLSQSNFQWITKLVLKYPEIGAAIEAPLDISQEAADEVAAHIVEAVEDYAGQLIVKFIAQVLALLKNDKVASAVIAFTDAVLDDQPADESLDFKSTPPYYHFHTDSDLPWGFLELRSIEDYKDKFSLAGSGELELWDGTIEQHRLALAVGANTVDYFQYFKTKIETDLKEIRDEAVRSGKRGWSVPSVRLVVIRQGQGLENV
jgi:hypothetical protein